MAVSCRDKIISEDYVEFVIDFPLEDLFEEGDERFDFCYQEVDSRVGILSINRNQLPDVSLQSNDYMSIPDILGLQQQGEEALQGGEDRNVQGDEVRGDVFDASPLVQSGITRVQSEPLNLTGRGVILAFADTGINY